MVSKSLLHIYVQVPELVERDLNSQFVPQDDGFDNAASIEPSESFWSGQSDGKSQVMLNR